MSEEPPENQFILMNETKTLAMILENVPEKLVADVSKERNVPLDDVMAKATFDFKSHGWYSKDAVPAVKLSASLIIRAAELLKKAKKAVDIDDVELLVHDTDSPIILRMRGGHYADADLLADVIIAPRIRSPQSDALEMQTREERRRERALARLGSKPIEDTRPTDLTQAVLEAQD